MLYEAVRLFVERATQVLPTFSLTPANALAVMQICFGWMGSRWQSNSLRRVSR